MEQLEFEFVGRDFRTDAPSCAAGTRLVDVPARSRLRLAVDFMPQMFRLRTVLVRQAVRDWNGGGVIRYRAILLPFGDSGGRLKYAAGAFSHILAKDDTAGRRGTAELLALRDGHWHEVEGETSMPEPASDSA
jgi:hypothetical protein